MLEVIPFRSEFLNAVCQIEQSLFPHPWSSASFLELANNETFLFYVAKEDSEVLGYFVCQLFPPEAELHNIAVLQEKQTRGIGSAMMAKLKQILSDRLVTSIYLLVRANSASAVAFYQRHKFVEIGRRRAYYENKQDALVMRCIQLIG